MITTKKACRVYVRRSSLWVHVCRDAETCIRCRQAHNKCVWKRCTHTKAPFQEREYPVQIPVLQISRGCERAWKKRVSSVTPEIPHFSPSFPYFIFSFGVKREIKLKKLWSRFASVVAERWFPILFGWVALPPNLAAFLLFLLLRTLSFLQRTSRRALKQNVQTVWSRRPFCLCSTPVARKTRRSHDYLTSSYRRSGLVDLFFVLLFERTKMGKRAKRDTDR